MDEPLWKSFRTAPKCADPKAARRKIADLPNEPLLAQMLETKPFRALLEGLADHSPYLWRLASADPQRLARLASDAPHVTLEGLLAKAKARARTAQDEASVMEVLRLAKQEAALVIALADIGGLWDVIDVTQALSRFADAMVSDALSFLLREAAADGKVTLPDLENPETGCGVVVLALGKHGARELNYSSDIDLVVFFDPVSPVLKNGVEPAPFFVRLTKNLSRLLQERTGDGYVLRVDLRLRPDPGSTAVAISLPAAFSYYENLGQNWERAALIKARPVAGDLPLGTRFLADLAPFIWRKYFDYAAIADIHAMKRQIHAVRGHAEITVAGHDVKLGRGGIREVEFFVQTQQLIFGGRREHLRGACTLDMLNELSTDGWVTPEAVRDLSEAYAFLRMVEHRLQMLTDEQTQRLPSDPEQLERFAKFCGFANVSKFSDALTYEMRKVELHYARLFEHAQGLDTQSGSLVFTGVTDDPETLTTLKSMGFMDAALAVETIRGWHFGRRAGVQSPRAREVLTELVPALLESFAGSGDPDSALAAFDAALSRMPAAIELFSILKSHAAVRDLFGDVLGGAPRLAQVVAQRPHVLDAVIDPASLASASDENTYDARACNILRPPERMDEFLDSARDMLLEENFLIGVRMLSGMIAPDVAGPAYTALAASLIRASLAQVEAAFALEYGHVPGGRCVVIGMGKLGSREMTATSDLDLVLIYDFDEETPQSDGSKSLHAIQYYTRLTQRLVSALTVATRRGQLYDVDMRLRPSGGKGPLATQWESYAHYQRHEAETWEHMALTRARPVAGDESLRVDFIQGVGAVIAQPRDPLKLRKDVYEMRALIAQEKGDDHIWDLKLVRGGLMDLEFIAQYLSLRYAYDNPDMIHVETVHLLRSASAAGYLAPDQGETLIAAHKLYLILMQMFRLSTEASFDPKQMAAGVLRRIAAAADLPDFRFLENMLSDTRADVRRIFEQILGRA